MTVINPVRDMWIHSSIPPASQATLIGLDVAVSNIVGPINVLVDVGPGLGAITNVTFEGATENPAAPGTPLAASWAPINKGGFCGVAVAPMTIAVDPANAAYVADGRMTVRDIFDCVMSPVMFVRAKISAAAPISVDIAGKARRQDQV